MDGTPENSYKFYQNKDCEYFPCHRVDDRHLFNCLFCYCPLYFLGEKCGGNFIAVGKGEKIKDCSQCLIPHRAENYEYIVKKIGENIEQL